MNASPIDIQVRQEQYADLLREAESERLMRAAGLTHPIGPTLVSLATTWQPALRRQLCRLAPLNGTAFCQLA